MTRRTTRMESCPTKVRTRQANRDRAMASGSASLTTSRRPKKRQTKPIWNRSKAWNRKNLSQKRPGRRGGNKAKVARGETRTEPGSRDGRPARQSGRRPVGREAQGSELLRVAGFPPLGRSGDLESPGDGQMKSRTYRVTLADLTKISEFRTKEDLVLRFSAGPRPPHPVPARPMKATNSSLCLPSTSLSFI